jgi:xanthine/CO dehydrogenase XdhC/CoxF family maturation factor
MHEITKTIAAVKRLLEEGKGGVLVTVVATRGSTYRRRGARVVISEEGEITGAISGGCLERDVAERVKSWIADPTPRLLTYDSTNTNDVVFGMGLGCRGEIEVLVEPFDPAHPPQLLSFRWNGRQPVVWPTKHEGRELLVEVIRPEHAIAIFGGGPDVEPVARLSQQVGWRAVVIAAKDVHPEEVREKVDLSAFDAAVVMTHNFLHDLALLSVLLPSAVPYVGLLGPKSRGEELLAQIGDIPAEQRARLHSPIGLDLGAETPDEIALSIVAEIQGVLSRHSARPLREVDGPIHARDGVTCP